MKFSGIIFGVAYGLSIATQAEANCRQPLMAPPGYYQAIVVKTGSIYDCPAAPKPFTETLDFNSKYEGSDSARATLNEQAEQEYRDAVENIRQLEKTTAEIARDYLRGAGTGARECLLDMLLTWANAEAMVTEEANHVGQAVRKWALASTGAAYLQIVTLQSGLPPLDGNKRQQVEDWFARLAQRVVDYYSDRPLRKVNNHDYWAAWSVMITAVNLQDCDLYNWAMTKFAEGIGQIDRQGFLPNELRRESRALNYQNYALQPLVMLASFAKANGENLDTETKSLEKLVNAVVQGIRNPGFYTVMTGKEQEMEGLVSGWSLAWIQPWAFYLVEQADPVLTEFPVENFSSTRLGGDLAHLYDPKLVHDAPATRAE